MHRWRVIFIYVVRLTVTVTVLADETKLMLMFVDMEY
jgi:hypothetical protein